MSTPPQPDALTAVLVRALYALALALLVLIGYGATLGHPFVFDDIRTIVQNTRMHDPAQLADLLARSRRPVVDLTLALNCYLAGCDTLGPNVSPSGFHFVNLLVHAGATLVLFDLVRRTIARVGVNTGGALAAPTIAFFVAALWGLHPIQTESVTYTIQRAESMMGLFFFLTLDALAIGAAGGRARHAWYALAVVACALGMGSKGVMIGAPLVALLYDRAFLAGSFAGALRHRWPVHALLVASAGVLYLVGVAPGVLGLNAATAGVRTVGFLYKGVTPGEYLATQPGVVLHYLRLLVAPVGQCLDYAWPVQRSLPGIVAPALLLAVPALAGAWGLWKNRWWGFVIAAFFIVLAPTSSFIPIKDLAFEHRMYVPSAGAIALLVAGAVILNRARARRAGREPRAALLVTVGVVAIGVLTGLTISRNRVYADEAALWRDVVAKRPNNIRAHVNLARYLGPAGENEEAIRVLERAIELSSRSPDAPLYLAEARHNLGNVLLNAGRMTRAVEVFAQVVEESPQEWRYWYSYARALAAADRLDDALEWYARVTKQHDGARIAPGSPDEVILYRAHIGAASCAVKLGRLADAVPFYKGALRVRPGAINAQIDLGATCLALRRWDDAEAVLVQALLAQPENTTALFNLAFCYQSQGRLDQAEAGYRRVLQIDPAHKQAGAQLRAILAQKQGMAPGATPR